MFEIDLLKGKGRPRRADLKRVVLRLALLLIPILTTLAYAVEMRRDHVRLEAMRDVAADNAARAEDYRDAVMQIETIRRDMNEIKPAIDEIGLALNYRLVVSEALAALAEQMPASIVLSEMDWRRNLTREQKTDDQTGRVRTEVVIHRSVRLTLHSDSAADGDAAVQMYIRRLNESPTLSPLVREIRPAARQQRDIADKTITQYVIELFLKEQR